MTQEPVLRRRPSQSAWLLALLLGFWSPVYAHHSPSVVVEALTDRIESGEHTASIFVQRGDEYRATALPESAAADYRSALEISAGYLPALYGLAQTRLHQHRLIEAIEVSRQGVAASRSADQAASFHALLAQTYEQQKQWTKALAAWRKSLVASHPKIDWYLGEFHALEKLNRPHAARLALESAMKRNPSVVLRRVWVKALIDCGDTEEASQHIEAGLARSRWKSSWLLLRARLELSQNHPRKAQRDAASALQEIDLRWNPKIKNPWIAADRQRALAILFD